MRLPSFRSEPGFWVSAGTHVGLLVFALFSVAAPALPEAQEGVPIEVITENQFSELTKGERNAEKPLSDAKPRADKKAEKFEEKEPENAKVDSPTAPTRTSDMKLANADEMPLRVNEPDPSAEAAKAAKMAKEKAEAEKADAAKAEAKAEAAKAEAKAEAAKAAAAEKAAAAKAEAKAAAAEAAKAEAVKREQLAKLVEREEAEAAAAEAKAADAKAKAEAKAKADAAKEAAKAAEKAAAAKAEAKAKAEAEAERQKEIAEAKAEEAKEKAEAAAAAKAEAAAKAKAKAVADARAKADAEAKARKQAELAAKFNAGDIKSILASKAPSQSTGSTGHEVQRTASLGAATGTAQRLSPSLRDALVGMLQQQIERCYSAPPGAAQGVVLPVLDIRLNADGSLSTEPRIMRGGSSSVDQSIAQAALRAVRRCAPYKIPAQYQPYYNDWKAINAEFEFTAT
ncbi:cell envelope integrity protein TolA [Methylobacterium sp. WL120]|uniref:cell envelope integrity protein TolA n=1 Tax=Methylobacterium sp. WL120 TaxID=2603887 RepID=UPI0011C91A99|nr:cell envelope integrity protein TolA [Methylobacterium sp. WL120]TXM70049.1 cell envelope integrity protein TolA [Methylobacterium sp. WL120]